MAADPAYRGPPADALCFAPLDALTAIYDRRSAQTHLVIAPMPEMLAAMGTDAVTPAELAARLSDHFDFDGDSDLVAAVIAARLAELAVLGLVSAV